MFRTTIKLTVLLLILVSAGYAKNWVLADKGLEQGKSKSLPLFLNFTGSDWCPWCVMMEKNIFATPEWQAFSEKELVPVYVDFPKGKQQDAQIKKLNNSLATMYGVQGFPTYLVVDPVSMKVLGQLGAERGATPQAFIEKVKSVLPKRELAPKIEVAAESNASFKVNQKSTGAEKTVTSTSGGERSGKLICISDDLDSLSFDNAFKYAREISKGIDLVHFEWNNQKFNTAYEGEQWTVTE